MLIHSLEPQVICLKNREIKHEVNKSIRWSRLVYWIFGLIEEMKFN